MDSHSSRKLWAAVATAVAGLAVLFVSVPGARAYDGYPHPRGASPVRLPMVPVFERCDWVGGGRRSDTVHGPGLTDASGQPLRACSNPDQVSGTVTIGTPDANGQAANSIATLVYTTVPGDVKIDFDVTDVRLQGSLADYPGELELSLDSRITDRNNGPSRDQPATTEEFFFTAPIPCFTTPDPSIGSTCSLHTTANTLLPNMIVAGKRTLWEHADHTHIYDGGPDWKASTENDNLAFLADGLFVP